jgi:hypothetical protein
MPKSLFEQFIGIAKKRANLENGGYQSCTGKVGLTIEKTRGTFPTFFGLFVKLFANSCKPHAPDYFDLLILTRVVICLVDYNRLIQPP